MQMCDMCILSFSVRKSVIYKELSRVRKRSEKFVIQALLAFVSAVRTDAGYLFELVFFAFLGKYAIYDGDHMVGV